MISVINKDLSKYADKLESIKITKRSIPMTLQYSDYMKAYLGSKIIPKSDIETYGPVISLCYRGGSAAPGMAYSYTGSEGNENVYASCIDATGFLHVTHMKGVPCVKA